MLLIEPISAITSWEDYEYQGHIALYMTLKKIFDLLQSGKSISGYNLQIEGEEDFSIREDDKYIKVYQQLGVHFIDCIKTDIDIKNGKKYKNFLKVFNAQIEQIKLIKKAGPFDLINLHYVDSDDMIYTPVLKKLTKSKLIFSYWGSDLFRAGDRQLFFRGIFARCADYITFDNKDLQIKFKKVYN